MSEENKSRRKVVEEKIEIFKNKKDATQNKNKLQRGKWIDKTYLVANRKPYKITKVKMHLIQLQEKLEDQKESVHRYLCWCSLL